MLKNTKNKIMLGIFLIYIYLPWTYVSYSLIPNSNIFTLIGVYALVTLVGLLISKHIKNGKEKNEEE